PDVSSTCLMPAVPLPTACQWKPPSAAPSETIFAANTCWLLRSPERPVGPSSYQTVQATVSFAPVNAMSGASPSRVGSTFRLGSARGGGVGRRGIGALQPDLWQEEAFPVVAARGFEASARRTRDRLLDAFRHEDLRRGGVVRRAAVVLLPYPPRHRVVARHG